MPKNKEQKSSKPDGWLDSAFVTPIELTVRQQHYARRAIGATRYIYNLAAATHRFCRINRLQFDFGRDKPGWPTANDIARELNSTKATELPWLGELSKFVPQGALADFEAGMRKRFQDAQQAKAAGVKCKTGFPKLKKRKDTGAGGFLAASGISITKVEAPKRIRLPYLGSVKLTRALPQDFILVNVRVKYRNGRWQASIGGYIPPKLQTACETQAAVGVDVGIDPLAASASDDGLILRFENPKAYYQAQSRLRRWQRALARRTPGSRSYAEAQQRIANCHQRITGIRRNAQHQLSKFIASCHRLIGIETLNVAGMDQLRWQAKAVRDAAIGELLRQIKYKARWYGALIKAAPRWFPSSKMCSSCEFVNRELKREKQWVCPKCGVRHDRDVNAAINLLNFALGAVRTEVTPGDGEALAAETPSATKPPRQRGTATAVRKNPDPDRYPGRKTQLRLAM